MLSAVLLYFEEIYVDHTTTKIDLHLDLDALKMTAKRMQGTMGFVLCTTATTIKKHRETDIFVLNKVQDAFNNLYTYEEELASNTKVKLLK